MVSCGNFQLVLKRFLEGEPSEHSTSSCDTVTVAEVMHHDIIDLALLRIRWSGGVVLYDKWTKGKHESGKQNRLLIQQFPIYNLIVNNRIGRYNH